MGMDWPTTVLEPCGRCSSHTRSGATSDAYRKGPWSYPRLSSDHLQHESPTPRNTIPQGGGADALGEFFLNVVD